MLNKGKDMFDEVSAKIRETIENSPMKDMEKNVKSMLGSAFNRMDLITREEFDTHRDMLLKSRETITALESRLVALEAKLGITAATEKMAEAATDTAKTETADTDAANTAETNPPAAE
ncbi:accessory factor UbiK family protein [Stenoxybacter acetivorans]|uniref:accessory factor UbiK family protein n=1 Tax=Stenoxybacter acetivorans TaxID=422441 RepID=UPI00068E8D39|nr:accessory factor UbiK family protein [Stenoxybacter acetivorans]